MLRKLGKFIIEIGRAILSTPMLDLNPPSPRPRKRREVVSVPTPILRDTIQRNDQMFQCLRLVDGLLSSGEVRAAQSQVRLTLIAVGGKRQTLTEEKQ